MQEPEKVSTRPKRSTVKPLKPTNKSPAEKIPEEHTSPKVEEPKRKEKPELPAIRNRVGVENQRELPAKRNRVEVESPRIKRAESDIQCPIDTLIADEASSSDTFSSCSSGS